jgi:hypothetical protein
MSITEREPIIRRYPQLQPWSDNEASDRGSIQPPRARLAAVDPSPDRKGLFGPLLDALHDSRRRQASRAIHQYRHLIAAPRTVKAGPLQNANIFEQPKGRIKMTTSEDINGRQNVRSANPLASKYLTWTLIAACVIGFGILHIAGGAMINGAVKPSTEMPPVQLTGD